MHDLEIPFALARFQIDTDQALAEQIIPGTFAAIIIRGWRFDRHINVPKLRIDGDLRPDAGVAIYVGRSVFPGVVTELAFFRDRMKSPKKFAGLDVEGTHQPLGIVVRLYGHAFFEC